MIKDDIVAEGRAVEVLQFRMITHVTTAQSLDIGDVDGHTASLAALLRTCVFSGGWSCYGLLRELG
jgi:hypothetical protein